MNPETPSPVGPVPTPGVPQEASAPSLPVHPFKHEGKNYRLFKRKPGKDAPWYFQIQRQGQRRPRCLETNVADVAIIKAKAAITAAKSENWETFLDKTALRKTCIITLSQVFTLYRQYPHRKPAATTRELNIHALRELLSARHSGRAQALETLPLSAIDADMVWDWKQKILAAAADQEESRHRQLLRSANSRLIQARSLFTNDLQSYYKRQGKLTLPKQIADFLKEPKFPTDECGKTDYWPPNDQIIDKTFTALGVLLPGAPAADREGPTLPPDSPHIAQQNLNLYKAIWLALGFGLRKAEIAGAKMSWFQNINGVLYCAGDVLAKNDKFPRVRCQLGAWDKLAHHLTGLDPDAHLIIGHEKERTDHVFRRCSTWMQALGWSTQKMIHEFRSYAGCQIAMGDRTGPVDLRSAQEFLRHANITTTENFYMRYLRSQLKEVHLQLPTPQPFLPKILEA